MRWEEVSEKVERGGKRCQRMYDEVSEEGGGVRGGMRRWEEVSEEV